ncbi:MAG: hypothetical protein IH851_03770 [Armatimonadetes bacterium]|nr:hypothetical protein [Armatimonadota bacterium]
MPLWPFRKRAAASGLTINRNFYLSVLGGPGALPTLLEVINPDGSNEAVRGYGAPLMKGASRDLLNKPLQRGSYALTTPEKKDVVRLDVFRRAEVKQFRLPDDPQMLGAAGLVGERLRRAEEAEHLLNLMFEGYSSEVYPAVQFMLDVARRLALLTEGLVADPQAETYRLPDEMRAPGRMDPRIDFRDIGAVKLIRLKDGWWVSTRGLSKFNLAEYEMFGIGDDLRETAAKMVIAAAQQALIGVPMKPGETAFAPDQPLEVVEGTREREQWGDRPALEFLDRGRSGASQGADAWKRMGN